MGRLKGPWHGTGSGPSGKMSYSWIIKKKIDYSRGNTLTGRSIEFAMEEAFTPLYGARKDEDAVQKILIVLTDGRYVQFLELLRAYCIHLKTAAYTWKSYCCIHLKKFSSLLSADLWWIGSVHIRVSLLTSFWIFSELKMM